MPSYKNIYSNSIAVQSDHDRIENDMNTKMPLLFFRNIKKEKNLQYIPINWINWAS